jgi:molecular chaperone DnaJ
MCPKCKGKGSVPDTTQPKCQVCDGKSFKVNHRKVKVNIPPGVESGQHLQLRNMGIETVPGGPKGNLLVEIYVQTDSRFERSGPHLLTKVNVPYTTAVLGGSVKVEGLDGNTYEIPVKEGSQVGDQVKIAGKGVPTKGDFICFINISVPTKVNDQVKTLLEALRNENL